MFTPEQSEYPVTAQETLGGKTCWARLRSRRVFAAELQFIEGVSGGGGGGVGASEGANGNGWWRSPAFPSSVVFAEIRNQQRHVLFLDEPGRKPARGLTHGGIGRGGHDRQRH